MDEQEMIWRPREEQKAQVEQVGVGVVVEEEAPQALLLLPSSLPSRRKRPRPW